MGIVLSEKDIGRLVAERKELPADYRKRMTLKPKRGHKEQELDVKGADGSDFRVILRQSDHNPLDFSAILAYLMPKSNVVIRLRRYNGKHGEHTNTLEGQTFYDYHIHMATERYQESGLDPDAFAQPTDRYANLAGAVICLIKDCGFVEPPGTQIELV